MMPIPKSSTNGLTQVGVQGTFLNAILNGASLFLTVAILTVALNNFEINKRTLEISEKNYDNTKSNANDSKRIVDLLEKINQKL